MRWWLIYGRSAGVTDDGFDRSKSCTTVAQPLVRAKRKHDETRSPVFHVLHGNMYLKKTRIAGFVNYKNTLDTLDSLTLLYFWNSFIHDELLDF